MAIRAWLPAALAVTLSSGILAGEAIPVVGAQREISIPLPAGLNGAQLLFEMDGYDVAALSRREGDRVFLTVGELALTTGEHYLLILARDADGNIDTVAEHRIEVSEREGVRESSSSWKVLLSSAYRVAGDPDEALQLEPRDTQNASLQWSGKRDDGAWIAEGNVALLFDSNQSLSTDGQRWQLPAIELRAGRRFAHGDVALAFGDSQPLQSDLVLSGFDRRGLRLEGHAWDERVTAQVFTLHADPLTSLDADLPPFDTDGAVTGARLSLAPLKNADAILLSASWVDGESALNGVGIANPELELPDPTLLSGRAWTVALDSFALDRALWLHGEWAQSRFDGDGRGLGDPAMDDDARRFALQLSSGGALAMPALEQWSLGVDWQRVGPRFHSLANLLLPSDLEAAQVNAQTAWRGLSVNAGWLQQHTDVDDVLLTPRIDSRQQQLALEFTPQTLQNDSGVGKWLGTPTVGLSYLRTANQQSAADALRVGADLDNRQRSLSATLSFAYELFNWGLSFDRLDRDDRSREILVDDFLLYTPAPDSRETVFGINASWNPSARFSVSPQWQRSRLREVQGSASNTDLWSLQVAAELVPDVLSLQFGWSDNRDQVRSFELPQDAQRLSSSNGNLALAYRLKWLTFQLRGLYGRNALESALGIESDRQWRALLSVDLNWEQGS